MESENELVSVLAHEIGHIVKRHISSRISKQKKISIATMGMMLAAIALGGGAATEALLAGSLAAGQSASLHFSRLDEEEADLLAYKWMKDMERDPHGQVKMLQTMRRIARYRRDMVPQYLLTHPNPEARLNYVQTLVSSDEKELEKYDTGNDFAFLRFKYRIMTMTRDTSFLRKYFTAISASSRTTEFEKTMASYGLAQLTRAENNYDESLELLQGVIDSLGQRDSLRIDRGIIEFESGNVDKAYTTLTAAYNTDRSNAYAAFALAKVCVEKGLLDRAESLYKSVMYTMPDLAKVYFELGRLSAGRGKEAASKFYLGKYHLLRGNLKLAERNMEIALESNELDGGLEKRAKEGIALIKRLKE
jgi:predicted Zn-dependent protease